MGVENFEAGLGVVEFIFGLDGVEEGLELDQGATFLLDEDDLADFSEVAEYVVHAVVVVIVWNRTHEQHT